MTVDQPAPAAEGSIDDAGSIGTARAASKPFLLLSLVFLAVSLVLGLVAALQPLAPDLFSGVGALGYGKVLPLATNTFLYGWLTIGLAGALVHVVVRTGGGTVSATAMHAVAGLMALGVVAGGVGIVLGFSEGRLLLEYPLWADALLLLGMLGFAKGIGQAARSAVVDPGPVRWYAVAASWWLILVFTAGNIPGLTGMASAYQTSFFRASLIGLWLASGGVAVVYAVIPRLAGREAFVPTRLTLLGFWSLAFVWALTAPADLTYGPAPDWLGTVGVIFSLALLIPTVVIFTDVVVAMRHRWAITRGDMTVRFAMLGLVLFAVWPLLNLMLALRASSAVVRFTAWVAAVEQVALFGAFTAWLIAYVYFAAPEILGRGPRRSLARTHYFASVLGLSVWSGASLVAGVTAGLTWVGIANEATVPGAGPGWRNTLDAVEVLHPVAFGGFALFVLAQVVFLANVLTGGDPVVRELVAVEDDEPDPELVIDRVITPSRLRLGVVGLFAIAAVLVWLVPTLETAGVEPTLLADTARTYEEGTSEARGRQIYMTEGCWYCHTQEVRAIVTDVGLGAVSTAGDYVHESPVLTGARRLGPDLMHVGSRPETDDPTWVVAHLADPRSQRPYSTMPAYDHLSATELEDLAAYIVASK